MALTDLKLKAANPAAKAYHLTDGHGLFLVVHPNGSKLWRWKYRFHGEYRLMAFGSYPIISLADARAAHAAARAELHRGIDPMAERKAEKSAELESRRRASTENDLSIVENPFSFYRQVETLRLSGGQLPASALFSGCWLDARIRQYGLQVMQGKIAAA